MASVNRVMLLGNVGQDPTVRFTNAGTPVANFSLATTERWRDEDGDHKERTEWHQIVIFGKLAEIIEKHVRKGAQLYIEGSLQTNSWKDKEGNDRKSTQVRAFSVQFIDLKNNEADARGQSRGKAKSTNERVSSKRRQENTEDENGFGDDDIEF